MVGAENVVQIVTDNAANYVAARKLLEQEFPTLYLSPCVAHCLNLILKDTGKLDDVAEIVACISKIGKFVYNHSIVLNFMRRFTSGRELLRDKFYCTSIPTFIFYWWTFSCY